MNNGKRYENKMWDVENVGGCKKKMEEEERE